jgi:hypothetical protein
VGAGGELPPHADKISNIASTRGIMRIFIL